MKNLWKLGLSILVVSVAAGCAHQMITEHGTDEPSGGDEVYEVTVKRVLTDYISSAGPVSVVILSNKENSKQVLPILVGMSEGRSINMVLKKGVPPRPGTHDLFASVLAQFRTKLIKVVITDLRRNTYIATMIMESRGGIKEIDARPSDAIALALRCAAPIFVSEVVIRKGGWMKTPQRGKKQSEPKKGDSLL